MEARISQEGTHLHKQVHTGPISSGMAGAELFYPVRGIFYGGQKMGRRFERTELVLGPNNLKRLAQTTAAVVGLGGVGGAAAEALARSGIGRLILIDHRYCLCDKH